MSDPNGTCEYVLDPDDPGTWGGDQGEDCHIDQDILDENNVWRCPHMKHGDSEKCIFHKRIANKNKEEVEERFLEIINQSKNDKKKEFISCSFGNITISGEHIGEENIYLSYSDIEGKLCIEDSRIESQIYAKGVTTTGEVKITNSEIDSKTDFRFSEFVQNLSISSATFKATVDFRSSTFNSSINIGDDEQNKVIFQEKLAFIGGNIHGQMRFQNVEFKGDALFGYPRRNKTTFNDDVFVLDSSFESGAYFCGIQFNEDVYFGTPPQGNNSSVFYSTAFFADTKIGGVGYFTGVRFEDYVFFGHPSFERRKALPPKDINSNTHLQFENQANFVEGANFRDCEFLGQSFFYDVEFGGQVVFSHPRFDKNGAIFDKRAFFFEAEFQSARFLDVQFRGGASFGTDVSGIGNAVFHRSVDFTSSEFNEKSFFNEVKFEEQATFDNVSFCETEFTGSIFERSGTFRNSNQKGPCFRGNVDFSHVIAKSGIDFQTIKKGNDDDNNINEFQEGVSFFNAEMNNSNFQGVSFTDTPNFNKTNLTGADFTSSNLVESDFENAILSRATLHGADLRGAKLYSAILGDVGIDEKTQFLGHPDDDNDTSPHTRSAIFSKPRCVYDPKFGRSRESILSRVHNRVTSLISSDNTTNERGNEEADVDKAKSVYRALEELAGKAARTRLQSQCFVRRQDLQKREYKRMLFGKTDGPESGKENTGREDKDTGNEKENKEGEERTTGNEEEEAESEQEGTESEEADTGNEEETTDGEQEDAEEKKESTESEEENIGNKKESPSLEERLIAGARYSRAKVARMTLLYGESPWRIIGISGLFVLAVGLVYPIFGWIRPREEGANPITWTRILDGEPLLLFESIYFSALTFTTLGMGDYEPLGGGGQALATINTAFGAILIALLVFVFGRRAAR